MLSFTPGDFVLASGQRSDYYIDCRITTLHAEGGRLAGIVLLDLIREHFPAAEAIGGLTMGADPLVSNTASASAWELADYREFLELDPDEDHGPEPALVHGFLVRKAEKTHGTGRRIEGFLKAGAQVVIVDDVCTTGGSTITAIEATREAGMNKVGGRRSNVRWPRCRPMMIMLCRHSSRSSPLTTCAKLASGWMEAVSTEHRSQKRDLGHPVCAVPAVR
jgi:orotate phosphoribosyltransferase